MPGAEQLKKEEGKEDTEKIESPRDAPGTSGIETSALPAKPSVSGISSAPSIGKSPLPSDCSVAILTTSANVVPPSPPPQFTEKQKEAIECLFNEESAKGKKTTLEEAQKKCCTTASLSSLSIFKLRLKQLVNYINYQVKKKLSASPQDLPAATTSKVDSWPFDAVIHPPGPADRGKPGMKQTQDCWRESSSKKILCKAQTSSEPCVKRTRNSSKS